MTGRLAGKRIVITRPRPQAEAIANQLRRHGATPILFCTIEIVSVSDTTHVNRAIDELSDFDWIVFTSANGVSMFIEQVELRTNEHAHFGDAQIAAVGPTTAGELELRGFKPHYVPSEYVADRIPDGLGDVSGLRVLLPRAARARKKLAEELSSRGALVEDLAVYDTAMPELDPDALVELERGVDAVTFTSSSSVEHFAQMTAGRTTDLLERAAVACIGPITAQTAEQLGFRVDLMAPHYTADGLIEALVAHFSDQQPSYADSPQ